MKRLITYRHINEYDHPSAMVKFISADLRAEEIECDTYGELENKLISHNISEKEIVSIVKMTY